MAKRTHTIAVLPGDGIGTEIVREALKVLEVAADRFGFTLQYTECAIGGAALDLYDEPLPQVTLDVCDKADAILLGRVGGPKWNHYPQAKRPEVGALLPLRQRYGLYCNLRPAKFFEGLEALSPLRADITQRGFDMVCVRELTGGIYFGEPRGIVGTGEDAYAYDTEVYSRAEIRRIAKVAFDLARSRRGHVTNIDKANVMVSSQFWREVVLDVAKDYPDVTLNHIYVDNATMEILKDPSQFDVMLCSNMFGDILSDECSMVVGSMGLLPSAALGATSFGIYEPAGGASPDLAGKNLVNPVAQILSAAMMLRHSLDEVEAADAIERAVSLVLRKGTVTQDLAIAFKAPKVVGTDAMGTAIATALRTIKNGLYFQAP